jgi:hypothetical protein
VCSDALFEVDDDVEYGAVDIPLCVVLVCVLLDILTSVKQF